MSALAAITIQAEQLPARTGSPRGLRDEFFGPQPTKRVDLPDPEPLISNLTRCVIEILAGAREIEQIARWVTEDVYQHLLKRVMIADRGRRARGATATRPAFTLGNVHLSEPRDGVIESVAIVQTRARVRAVAIRLEGTDGRWRATVISVL